MSNRNSILAAGLILVFSFSPLLGQDAQVPRSVLQQAASDFQAGRVSEAEQALRAALKQAPRDPAGLGLLGVVLDAQNQFEEAEKAYQQALALAPRSPALLNNLGNHYMAQGKTDQARAAYLKVVAIDPRHANANLQLAQLSVAVKQGAAALKYLNQLAAEEQASPPVAILRARALKLTGQGAAAAKVLAEVEKNAGNDPRIAFPIGLAFAEGQRFDDAEKALPAHWMRTPPISISCITWGLRRSTPATGSALRTCIELRFGSGPMMPIAFSTWRASTRITATRTKRLCR